MLRLWHKMAGAAIGLASLCAVGCGNILLRDIRRQADGWTILLEGLRDGPNSIGISGGQFDHKAYVAASGQHFIWAFMQIHNDLNQDRVFSYDACDVDLDDRFVLPTVISRYMGPTKEIERNENYPPGDLSHRILIYSYPNGRLPARLHCPGFTFDLPKGAKPY